MTISNEQLSIIIVIILQIVQTAFTFFSKVRKSSCMNGCCRIDIENPQEPEVIPMARSKPAIVQPLTVPRHDGLSMSPSTSYDSVIGHSPKDEHVRHSAPAIQSLEKDSSAQVLKDAARIVQQMEGLLYVRDEKVESRRHSVQEPLDWPRASFEEPRRSRESGRTSSDKRTLDTPIDRRKRRTRSRKNYMRGNSNNSVSKRRPKSPQYSDTDKSEANDY
jgi:hypothetical protein